MNNMKEPENNSSTPVSVTCPRCGKTFICSRSSECWCTTMELTDEIRSYLAAHYDTCVCRECLEELQAKNRSHE